MEDAEQEGKRENGKAIPRIPETKRAYGISDMSTPIRSRLDGCPGLSDAVSPENLLPLERRFYIYNK